jgi:hypothetical protein
MGGIKHGNWGMIPGGGGNDQTAWMKAVKQKDPMEKHWELTKLQMAAEAVVNCQLCGKQIIAADSNEQGFNSDWETEIQAAVHTKCKNEYMREMMDAREAAQAKIEREFIEKFNREAAQAAQQQVSEPDGTQQ